MFFGVSICLVSGWRSTADVWLAQAHHHT